jgi:hypothetical protein
MVEPKFQKELDKLNLECAIENEMALASLKMGFVELKDRAYLKGINYGDAWLDGWNSAVESHIGCIQRQAESTQQKHSRLLHRWGLE